MNQSLPHLPVLLEETISQLYTDPNGIYLDGTVGFGGHAEELLTKLAKQDLREDDIADKNFDNLANEINF